MIVVATADFELYHGVVGELRDRGVAFTTIEPGGLLPKRTTAVITGIDDDLEFETDEEMPVVRADATDPRRAVEGALVRLRGGDGRTIIGIDPGDHPGIAVLHGDLAVAVFQVPLEDAVAYVREEVANAVDPLVRIGDGARLQGSRLINALEDAQIELVDETGTTPYLGTGVRGSGDVIAAINIARIEGEPVDSREIEPTDGEIQVVKNRSRERSPENRTLPADLAKQVALGELTMGEALDQHKTRE